MKSLKPFIEDDPESPEARLLRSMCLDEPSESSKRRVLAAVGTASGVAVATGAGKAAASTLLAKGVAVTKVVSVALVATGAALGVSRVAGLHAPSASEQSRPPSSTLTRRSLQKEVQLPPKVIPAPVVTGREQPLGTPDAVVQSSARPEPVIIGRAGDAEDSSTFGAGEQPTHPRDREDENAALMQEASTINQARRALDASDARGALRLLDEYQRRFRRPQLAPEAMAVRVEALVGLARMTEARSLADRLLSSESGRAYANRIRSILQRGEPPSKP
jgi:hypothetical protein